MVTKREERVSPAILHSQDASNSSKLNIGVYSTYSANLDSGLSNRLIGNCLTIIAYGAMWPLLAMSKLS